MNAVICAIAKNENKYINDWAHYYFNLGFDHIYLYDNNLSKDPYVGDCFDEDIKDKITIFDVRDICGNFIQQRSYNNFYIKYKDTFDWCLFCDIDEFLDGISDIHEFFNTDKFDEFGQIRIRWRLFGDDDVIERDESIPVYEFFKKPITDKKAYIYQGKSILRGGLNDVVVDIHYARSNNKSCTPSGKEYDNIIQNTSNIFEYENETIFINHYRTKTLKEFLDQKYERTSCCCGTFKALDLDYFFAINKNTPEKQEYLKQWLDRKLEERRK